MDSVISLLAIALMGLALLPLVLLGLYVMADFLGLKLAERALGAAVGLLSFQWAAASVLNILAGVALALLGVWLAWRAAPFSTRLAGALLLPFGLWRMCRGILLLHATLRQDKPRHVPPK